MKVAIVHDYLNQYGGAERVLEAFLAMFPEAHLYTLLYDRERLRDRFRNHLRGTSFLNSKFVARHHRPFIPLMPLAVRTMTLYDDYDLVISTSAGFAKGIIIRHRHRYREPRPFHLSYCHTPLRYAWETEHYFGHPIYQQIFGLVFRYLKRWDFEAGRRPDAIIANSKFIRGKIASYYGRESEVVYPPVDYQRFYYDVRRDRAGGYFLAVGRILHYKRFDLVVRAFATLGLPLKVLGSGPEASNLKSQISTIKNVEMIPFASDEELRDLYARAEAFIFPQVEDFGLVAAEAQACGTPAIAFRAGGALEIVREGETGIFFDEQSPEAIVDAVVRFRAMEFDRARIARVSRRFTMEEFRRGIMRALPSRLI